MGDGEGKAGVVVVGGHFVWGYELRDKRAIASPPPLTLFPITTLYGVLMSNGIYSGIDVSGKIIGIAYRGRIFGESIPFYDYENVYWWKSAQPKELRMEYRARGKVSTLVKHHDDIECNLEIAYIVKKGSEKEVASLAWQISNIGSKYSIFNVADVSIHEGTVDIGERVETGYSASIILVNGRGAGISIDGEYSHGIMYMDPVNFHGPYYQIVPKEKIYISRSGGLRFVRSDIGNILLDDVEAVLDGIYNKNLLL